MLGISAHGSATADSPGDDFPGGHPADGKCRKSSGIRRLRPLGEPSSPRPSYFGTATPSRNRSATVCQAKPSSVSHGMRQIS